MNFCGKWRLLFDNIAFISRYYIASIQLVFLQFFFFIFFSQARTLDVKNLHFHVAQRNQKKKSHFVFTTRFSFLFVLRSSENGAPSGLPSRSKIQSHAINMNFTSFFSPTNSSQNSSFFFCNARFAAMSKSERCIYYNLQSWQQLNAKQQQNAEIYTSN